MKIGGGALLKACHTWNSTTSGLSFEDAGGMHLPQFRPAMPPRSACNSSSFEVIGSKVPRLVRTGFTLTEILLTIAIVGVIAALVLPAIVTNYQNRALDIGYEREYKTISGSLRNLAVSENKVDFYSTMMYSASAPDSYDETSGKFIKKYLKVSKYCGDSNGDCFAEKYYNYDDTTHKKNVYEPVYKGACANLKNGASICLTPQVGGEKISGLIDINGKKGPNVFGRDLRHFTIDPQVNKTSLSSTTTEVLSTSDPEGLKPNPGPCAESSISKECCDTQTVKKGDPCCIHYKSQLGHPCYEAPEPPKSVCEIDPNSLDCCKTKTIASNTDACCNYPEIKSSNSACNKDVHFNVNCSYISYKETYSTDMSAYMKCNFLHTQSDLVFKVRLEAHQSGAPGSINHDPDCNLYLYLDSNNPTGTSDRCTCSRVYGCPTYDSPRVTQAVTLYKNGVKLVGPMTLKKLNEYVYRE